MGRPPPQILEVHLPQSLPKSSPMVTFLPLYVYVLWPVRLRDYLLFLFVPPVLWHSRRIRIFPPPSTHAWVVIAHTYLPIDLKKHATIAFVFCHSAACLTVSTC